MKRIFLILLAALLTAAALSAQVPVYISMLSGSGATASLTVQNPVLSAANTRTVTILGFSVDCAACTATIARTGATATVTTNAVVAGSQGFPTPVELAFANSGVSAGTTISSYSITVTNTIPLFAPLGGGGLGTPMVVLARGLATVDNFTVSVSGNTGAYIIRIVATEN